MKARRTLSLTAGAIVALVGVAVFASAETNPPDKSGMTRPAKSSKMQPQFDRMKKMAGEWVATGGDGKVVTVYKVTGAGSALVETMFPGSDHEMVTVYTLDGDNLILTHYCAAGNAPRMKASPGGKPNELVFKYAGASNLASPNEGHMHDVTIWFVDDDRVKTEWIFWENGKKKSEEKFDHSRKKS